VGLRVWCALLGTPTTQWFEGPSAQAPYFGAFGCIQLWGRASNGKQHHGSNGP